MTFEEKRQLHMQQIRAPVKATDELRSIYSRKRRHRSVLIHYSAEQ
jgi:hypothetical protein